MKTIIQLACKSKHWQIFTAISLFIVVGMYLHMMNIFSFIAKIDMNENNINPFEIFAKSKWVFVLFLIGTVLHFLWLLGVGKFLHFQYWDKISSSKSKVFIAFFITLIINGILALLFIRQMVLTFSNLENIETITPDKIIPMMSFFGLFFIANIVYFVLYILVLINIAKALVSLENQNTKYNVEYVGEFFLLLFFPIGIWLLQPRINRLYQAYEQQEIDNFPIN